MSPTGAFYLIPLDQDGEHLSVVAHMDGREGATVPSPAGSEIPRWLQGEILDGWPLPNVAYQFDHDIGRFDLVTPFGWKVRYFPLYTVEEVDRLRPRASNERVYDMTGTIVEDSGR